MNSATLSLLIIGGICGLLAALLVSRDYSRTSSLLLPIAGGIAGSFLGGSTVGASALSETLRGVGSLVASLAQTSGRLLIGGILIFPSVICGLLLGFTAALIAHTFFPPRSK